MKKLSKDCKISYFGAFIDQIRAEKKLPFSDFIQKSEKAKDRLLRKIRNRQTNGQGWVKL